MSRLYIETYHMHNISEAFLDLVVQPPKQHQQLLPPPPHNPLEISRPSTPSSMYAPEPLHITHKTSTAPEPLHITYGTASISPSIRVASYQIPKSPPTTPTSASTQHIYRRTYSSSASYGYSSSSEAGPSTTLAATPRSPKQSLDRIWRAGRHSHPHSYSYIHPAHRYSRDDRAHACRHMAYQHRCFRLSQLEASPIVPMRAPSKTERFTSWLYERKMRRNAQTEGGVHRRTLSLDGLTSLVGSVGRRTSHTLGCFEERGK